jgi:hypothetical protein
MDNAAMSSRSSDAGQAQPGRVAGRLLALTAANVAGAVHGAILIGLLFSAEDARRVGYADTIAAAVVVLALYWLTGIYAHDLAGRLQRREPVEAKSVWRISVHELPVLEGGFIPVLALVIAWAAGASVTAAVTAGVWTTALTIVALEVLAGWRAHLGRRRLWLQAWAGAAMGLAIILLKFLLH